MAFADDKYYLQFIDIQGRTHTVYLDPDGYSGAGTELTTTADPLVFSYGANRSDDFAPVGPTSIEISFIADDYTVFDEIYNDDPMSWRVRWDVDATVVWTGFLLTDEMEHEFDVPHEVRIRAVDGLTLLNHITYAPASANREAMIVKLADALGDLTGLGLGIGAAANWHGYAAGAAVSGNSFARYEIEPTAFRDEATTDYAKSSVVAGQIVGRFGAQLTQARNKWRAVQRTLITGTSYVQQTYTSAGAADSTETVSRLEIDTATAPLIASPPAVFRTLTPNASATVKYQHGPDSWSFIKNPWFTRWTGAATAAPDDWTEVDEDVGTAPNTGSIVYRSEAVNGAPRGNNYDRYACGIYKTSISLGSAADVGTNYAKVGIKQTSATAITTGTKVVASLDVRLDGATTFASTAMSIHWSLWVEGSSGDYYWNNRINEWVSGSSIGSPPAAAKNWEAIPEGINWQTISFETNTLTEDSIADPGPITIILYGPVAVDSVYGGSVSSNLVGALFDNVTISLVTTDDSYLGSTVTAQPDGVTLGRPDRATDVFFIGQGPSSGSKSRITYGSGTYAAGWKAGAYAGAEADTGTNLDALHAKEIMQVAGAARRSVRVSFRMLSGGSYWQDQAMLLESTVYRCAQLLHSARTCDYTGEWNEVSSVTISDAPEIHWEPYWITTKDVVIGFDPTLGEGLVDYSDGYPIPPKGTGGSYPQPQQSSAGSTPQVFTRLGVGDQPNIQELVNLRATTGDVAILFDSGVGGGGRWLTGIDTSDSNKFKIGEGLALGSTPDAGVGDRLVIDGSGNFTINPAFGGTSYTFTLDEGGELVLDGKASTVGDTYKSSGATSFVGHYWTGTDNIITAQVYLEMGSASATDYSLRFTTPGPSMRLTDAAGVQTFALSDVDFIQGTPDGYNPFASQTLDSPGVRLWGQYTTNEYLAQIQYKHIATGAFNLNLIAYSDAGSTAGETFAVKSAGGVSWGGMTFPSADGTANQVLQTNGSGAVSWATIAGGVTDLDDLSDVTITAAARGELLVHNGTAWVDFAVGTSGQFLKTQGAGADPVWATVSVATLDDVTDVVLTTVAQGDILYRNGASEWANLPPGTSGYVLKTQGAAANPLWGTLASSDLSDAANVAHVNATETISAAWTFQLSNLRVSGATTGTTLIQASDTVSPTITLPALTGTLYASGNTDVAVADGGTGASTLTGLLQGNGTSAITGITNSSTVGQVLRVTGASTYAWGALNLADTDAVTGSLPIANVADYTNIAHINAAETISGVWQYAQNKFALQNVTSGLTTINAGDGGTITLTLPTATGTLLSSADSINAFADVTITSAAEGDTLIHNGSVWVNTFPAWHNLFSTYSQDSTALNTQASLLNGSTLGSKTIAANTLKAGTIVHFRAWGTVTTDTENLTLRFFFNTTGSGTEAFSLAGPTTDSLSAVAWTLDVWLVVKTAGAGGTLQVSGRYWVNGAEAGVAPAHITSQQESIDTTAANTIELTAQWSAAGTSTIYCDHAAIDITRQAL